jgi:hypothetical protein
MSGWLFFGLVLMVVQLKIEFNPERGFEISIDTPYLIMNRHPEAPAKVMPIEILFVICVHDLVVALMRNHR